MPLDWIRRLSPFRCDPHSSGSVDPIARDVDQVELELTEVVVDPDVVVIEVLDQEPSRATTMHTGSQPAGRDDGSEKRAVLDGGPLPVLAIVVTLVGSAAIIKGKPVAISAGVVGFVVLAVALFAKPVRGQLKMLLASLGCIAVVAAVALLILVAGTTAHSSTRRSAGNTPHPLYSKKTELSIVLRVGLEGTPLASDLDGSRLLVQVGDDIDVFDARHLLDQPTRLSVGPHIESFAEDGADLAIAGAGRFSVVVRDGGKLSPIFNDQLSTEEPGDPPPPVAVGLGAGWFGNATTEKLDRVDLTTLQVLPIPVPGNPIAMAIARNHVWLLVEDDFDRTDYLMVFDAAGRQTAKVFIHSGAQSLVIAGEQIWIANPSEREVIRLSVQTGHASGSPISVAGGTTELAADRHWIYAVSETGDLIQQINPATGRVAKSLKVDSEPISALAGPAGLFTISQTDMKIDEVRTVTEHIRRPGKAGQHR